MHRFMYEQGNVCSKPVLQAAKIQRASNWSVVRVLATCSRKSYHASSTYTWLILYIKCKICINAFSASGCLACCILRAEEAIFQMSLWNGSINAGSRVGGDGKTGAILPKEGARLLKL
mmetsp:Transcript_85785/g.156314  ORF Transcript_85785/g.156314 Transcript_85785/m.156314 type:complete len:118 (+) Transcript_85785:1689-2042(+)